MCKLKLFFLMSTIMTFIIIITVITNNSFGTNHDIFVNKDKYSKLKGLFLPVISPEEKELFRDIMKAFNNAVRLNITYFLYGGTLYGSYYYHGMVPWDDDLDIIVKENDQTVLKECLKSLSPKFELFYVSKTMWKVFHKDSFQTRLKWKWPFLDILFYREGENVLCNTYNNDCNHPKEDVFPLVKRPFMGLMLPAPRHTRNILAMHYDLDTCKTNTYDHKQEIYIPKNKRAQVPCDALFELFPFVQRTKNGHETIETLQGGDFHDNTPFVESLFNAEEEDGDDVGDE